MHRIQHIPRRWRERHKTRVGGKKSVVSLAAAALHVTACAESPAPVDLTPVDPPPAIEAEMTADCISSGALRADLSIGNQTGLDWDADELACEGMRRPDNDGARLRFAGSYDVADEQKSLTLILGIPGLREAQIGTELPTHVTLVEEGSGRFYATPDTNGCWTDVTEHERIGSDSDQRYRISGDVFCVSPLAEVNGSANVAFTELHFTGRVNWELEE